MHSFKEGRLTGLRLVAPQAAIGVVGNPSLCPAFRVRRGREREFGLTAGRARRAPRPTPPFRAAPTSAAGECAGHHSPSASPSATTASFRSVEKRRRRATPVITSTFENVSDIGVCLGLCLGPPAIAGVCPVETRCTPIDEKPESG